MRSMLQLAPNLPQLALMQTWKQAVSRIQNNPQPWCRVPYTHYA